MNRMLLYAATKVHLNRYSKRKRLFVSAGTLARMLALEAVVLRGG